MRFFIIILFSLMSLSVLASERNLCQQDAKEKSEKLLRFHFSGDSTAAIDNLSIDEKVMVRRPIHIPVGKGYLDVFETTGYIYKGMYRMRFIYAQIRGTCALMGQEILELSNPY